MILHKIQLGKARYGGATEGIGVEGMPVFVPFAIPGETVEARLAQSGGDAELVQVVSAAPDRVSPQCRHFGVCGGCQYQHIVYAAQVVVKVGILRDLLESAGLAVPPQIATHTGAAWGYRNRIRLRLTEVDGAVSVGYSGRGSNRFLPIAECPIAASVLWRAAEALVRLAAADPVCGRWLRAVSEVELFTVSDETRLQMSFYLKDAEVARQEPEGFAGFSERIKSAVPELAGAGAEMDPELGRRARRAWDGDTWGAAGLAYVAAGPKYWVGRGSFFQVNRFLVDDLVALTTRGRTGKLAWDLYAGVGLFSRALAEGFAEVVAVEGAEGSANDLMALARALKSSPKLGRILPVHAPTVDFLRERVLQRERPELIVMDPPRAGVGVEACGLLGRMRIPQLVYVSCDPVTLARDLKILTGAGYALEEVHLVDLFPQTFHLETVAMLRYPG